MFCGGANVESNWALSCRACNLHNGIHREAIDAQTGVLVPLFHPRQDRWDEHFSVEENTGALLGLTPVGRATMARLQMNRPAQFAARQQWMRLRLFPTL